MSAVDAILLGERVRQARERAGLKQGELGDQVSLDRTTVNKIEKGTRKVTALELSDIARALGVRMSSFFTEPVPALISHRARQGVGAADSKIDRLLASLASDVEFVQSLAPHELTAGRMTSPAIEAPSPPPRTRAAADELATHARRLLACDATEPLRDLAARVATIGLWAFSSDLGLDTADAGIILLREGGVCLVNSHNKVGRRRLALAHELGHYLVADDYTIDWRVSEPTGDLESRLDSFARSLLLPEAGLRNTWTTNTQSHAIRESAVLTASEFRVDMATLARRLSELTLVDGDQAALIRTTSTTQTDIVEFGLNIPTDLEGTSLPVAFQKAVIGLVRGEKISRERALVLLRDTFNEDDLPDRRARRENEIWNFVS